MHYTIQAQLPKGSASRVMSLCLTRNGKGWSFCMHADGCSVPLRSSVPGYKHTDWQKFRTRTDAAAYAAKIGLPRYAVWRKQTKSFLCIDSLPEESRVLIHARDRNPNTQA
jgi:hypothetical protein